MPPKVQPDGSAGMLAATLFVAVTGSTRYRSIAVVGQFVAIAAGTVPIKRAVVDVAATTGLIPLSGKATAFAK